MSDIKLGAVVLKEPGDLTPFEKNAKLHPPEQIRAIMKSIKENGFRNKPVEILSNGTIVNGHGRWMACKELGMTKIPCVVLDDMTDNEIRKYRITDNKVADTGFDNMLLKDEMILLDADGVDFTEFFNDKELDFLTGDLGDMDLSAITGDLASDVSELSEATQNSIDGEGERTVALTKALGYSTITESEQRAIIKLQAHAEGTTGLSGGAALSLFARDSLGL
jgi:hypothetical protein